MLTSLISVPVIGAIVVGVGKAACFVSSLPVQTTENAKQAVKLTLHILGIPC